MTDTELKQLEVLRQDLDSAHHETRETRLWLQQSTEEARLYRSLFWAMLAIVSITVIVTLLRP
jgi:hypothetical protein